MDAAEWASVGGSYAALLPLLQAGAEELSMRGSQLEQQCADGVQRTMSSEVVPNPTDRRGSRTDLTLDLTLEVGLSHPGSCLKELRHQTRPGLQMP